MASHAARFMLSGLTVVMLLAGCNRPPGPPSTINGIVPVTLTVQPSDSAEQAVVTNFEKARANYKYRLEVLNSYYLRTGDMDKSLWATREADNLRKSQTFKWENVPQIEAPSGESVDNADPRVLVELTVAARRAYRQALDELYQFYQKQDPDSYKAIRVKNTIDRFDPVYTYMYFLSAELPGSELRPVEVIPDADRMYEQAMKLYRQGRIGLAMTDYDKERQSLMILLDLVRKYPHSTRIAMSAYFIAEIYKEFFNEDVRAVAWYERAWQWDPNVTEPARFQAAALYDLRLHNWAKAVELYRASLQHDPSRWGHAEVAERRIRELTEEHGQPLTPPSTRAPMPTPH